MTLLNVLGVVGVLSVLNVLNVLDMSMGASLACWALFTNVSWTDGQMDGRTKPLYLTRPYTRHMSLLEGQKVKVLHAYGRTDGPTDGRTNTRSHGVARRDGNTSREN